MDEGPWTFNNYLLVLHELKPGEEPTKVLLFFFAPFWVQVYELLSSFFSDVVGVALANFIGAFIQNDIKNVWSLKKPYMRIRTQVDIRQPLQKGKKVRKLGGEWIVYSFKYVKLPTFCFLCGLIGHIEKHCDKIFSRQRMN